MAKEALGLVKKAEAKAEDIKKKADTEAFDITENAKAEALLKISEQQNRHRAMLSGAKEAFKKNEQYALAEAEAKISKKCKARREEILSKKDELIGLIIDAIAK